MKLGIHKYWGLNFLWGKQLSPGNNPEYKWGFHMFGDITPWYYVGVEYEYDCMCTYWCFGPFVVSRLN